MTSKKRGEALLVDGLLFELVRSPRRKTLTVEVAQTGVKVRAPERMREATIYQFLRNKRRWIERHLADLPAPTPPLELETGAELRFLGETYRLRITSGRKSVHVDQGELVVPVVPSHLPREQTVKRKLVKWYKETAHQYLADRVARRAEAMFEHPTTATIKVRDYKRRWGSCDHRGDLSFNWRIMMAPETVIDYVVVHELAHLIEFNHSRRFWQIVEHQLPGWREQQQWLSKNGGHLYRF
ncbi:MAG: SprT family zinc-dependent metalloprotease [Pseudomonadota bacterium]